MAEEVSLPGGGKINKTLLIAAGALAAGIVGYAWWRKRGGSGSSGGPTTLTVDPNDAFGSTDRVTPGGGGSDNSGGGGTPAVDTDEKWTQAATDYLVRLGYDPGAVATALGKYLSRQKLKTTPVNELDIVRAARGAFGPPPRSGDIPIVADETTPPDQSGQGLTAPANLRVVGSTPTHVTLAWDPVAGAKQYEIQLFGREGYHPSVFDTTPNAFYTSGPMPIPDFEYRFAVHAEDGPKNGPDSQVTGRTSKKGS